MKQIVALQPSDAELEELREFDGGPDQACCHHMAQHIQSLYGYQRVDGYFEDDGGPVPHSWNITKTGMIIETAGSQFTYFEGTRDIMRIHPGEPDHARYRPDVSSPAAKWARDLNPPGNFTPYRER